MPFDWMHVDRVQLSGDSARAQFDRAVKERARLFYNLGYGADDALRRIAAAAAWEYDADISRTPMPASDSELAALISSVYARMTGGRAATSPAKTDKKG